MSWFENQIEERREADSRLLEDSLVRISGVIMGEEKARKLGDERMITRNAIDEVLKDGTYMQWFEEARKRAEELGM